MFQSASNHQRYFAAYLNAKSKVLNFTFFFRNPIKDQRPPPCPQMPTVKMQNPPCPFHTFNPLCGDVEPFRLSPLLKKTLQHMLKRYIVRQLCRYFLHIANFLFFARKMPTIRNIWFCHHVDCLVLLLRSFILRKNWITLLFVTKSNIWITDLLPIRYSLFVCIYIDNIDYWFDYFHYQYQKNSNHKTTSPTNEAP